MAYLNIRTEEDPILRKVSRPVTEITPRILELLDDMVETMHRADGCGLAAVQVGVLRRVVVVEVNEGEIFEMINPRIIAREGEQREVEGCLSLPGKQGITLRPKKVTVEATDRHGNLYTVTGEDLLARAFCHELDHLDGKLYVDCAVRMLSEDE